MGPAEARPSGCLLHIKCWESALHTGSLYRLRKRPERCSMYSGGGEKKCENYMCICGCIGEDVPETTESSQFLHLYMSKGWNVPKLI